jgi:ABC-type nitrate/sulfonate/bicarbonate transport system substrate-binding protein
MLQHELGATDPAKAHIKLVNLPTQAVAAKVPKGVDATVVGYPAVLKQMETDDSIVGVINSHGVTEAGYVGDAGKGAGIELPSAKESVFAPEGFYGHRSFWVARNEVIEKHPKVVQAFLTAEQQATTALLKQDPKTVAESVKKYWDLSGDSGAKVLDDEILFNRGWIWAAESDAQLLKKLSDLMAKTGVIQRPLDWTKIVDAFRKPAELSKAAYKASGSQPPQSGFAATESDARGAPVWKLDTWSAPK